MPVPYAGVFGAGRDLVCVSDGKAFGFLEAYRYRNDRIKKATA